MVCAMLQLLSSPYDYEVLFFVLVTFTVFVVVVTAKAYLEPLG